MRYFFLLLLSFSAYANVCTPLTVPANGPFPAIGASGADSIGSGAARIQWTSDASSGTPATAQQIVYSTAAEWAANPGTYQHTTAQQAFTVTSSTVIQGGIASNLIPSTLYHFEGQSFQGGSWCSATDETFTTTALNLNPPTLPIAVDTTRPTSAGTHWYLTNGGTLPGGYSACGTTAGGGYTADTTNWQNCLDSMVDTTGDDLTVPVQNYLISQANLHNSANAVAVTCSTGTSICTRTSGSAPANGSRVIIASDMFGVAPSPINPGIPYYIVNSSGSDFQLSTSLGGSPETLLNTGITVDYIPYPLTAPKMAIKAASSAGNLPPIGVRLGADSLAQYLPNMPTLQGVDPILGGISRPFIQYAPLTMNLTWENIAFGVDPTVATTNSSDAANPMAWISPIGLNITNWGITYDQCAFLHPGAPTRIAQVSWNGVNNSLINSYSALDFAQPHYYVPSFTYPTVSGNTITIPPFTFSYPGTSGTKVQCPSSGGTITMSGAGSGVLLFSMGSNCALSGILTNGLSATTTISGLTFTNQASPAWPTWTYTSPLGFTQVNRAGMQIYGFTYTSGAVADTNATIMGNLDDVGVSNQRAEGSTGFEIAAWGPFKFDNNYIQGSAIGGIFWADDLTLGATPCGTSNPCPVKSVLGNLTVTRNTITTDTVHFFYDSLSWDGGNRYWRNLDEQKAGRYSLWKGNKFGPWSAQVGEGQCGLHEEFSNQFIQIGNYPSYADSSDWSFISNTCFNMASTNLTTSYSFQQSPVYYGYVMRNSLISNNLFWNNNAYSATAQNQPFPSKVYPGQSSSSCPQGQMMQIGQGENFNISHITVDGSGGCQPFWFWQVQDLTSSSVTGSILNIVNDPGPFSSYNNQYGTLMSANGYLAGSCANTSLSTLFGCINSFNWNSNAMLATWTNSLPGSQVDFTSAQITAAISAYGSYGSSSYWPNANTLAGRISQLGWANPANGNFRLISSSPCISGAHFTLDGLDCGIDQNQMDIDQGNVSNVRILSSASTAATIGLYAPDSFACGVDWGTTAFYSGTGSWTRVNGAAGSPDPRNQSVALTGLPAHGLIYYRLNCAVMQPTGTIQLP